MALSEPAPQPVQLNTGRIAEAVALSADVGWNQNEADWRMMVETGHGFGYDAPDGHLVATAMILPFGGRFGWISMVIVDRDWRRRGLASRLLQTCVEGLERRGLVPVLDATPDGQAVYSRLGFQPLLPITRWEKEGDARGTATFARGDQLPPMIEELDRSAFGGERGTILRALWRRAGGLARVADGCGYLLARDGRRALQIGPLCATQEAWAADTLEAVLNTVDGPVFVDVPDHQETVSGILRRRGFRVQRPFLRMAKGDMKGVGDPARIFAIAGPELG